MSALSRFILRQPTALIACFSVIILALTLSVATAQTPRAPQIGTSVAELVFAGIVNRSSIPTQPIVITNTGDQTLTLASITKQTANTGAFTLSGLPSFPANINPGNSITINVSFAPGSSTGRLTTTVVIDATDVNVPDVTVPLYGLSAPGLEGSNEPTLGNVVKTLGININVGFTGLTSDTEEFPIGEEVILPLMVKAGAGVVTLRPVARYSPEREIEFGYYFPNGSNPTLNEIATISDSVSETVQYPPNHQTLNPVIDAGGSLTFDPGTNQFGVFVEGLSNRLTYTEDALNADGPTDHAVRIYPLKNRAGTLVPNSYLIGFEDAANGDYQDYMFVISNVRNPNAPVPTDTPTNTPTDTSTSTPTDEPTLIPLTETPIPEEPSSTPSLPATETPPGPTVTGTPPTSTLAPQRDVELLTNSSFEIDFDGNNLPDSWNAKNIVQDKLKCNKPEAGKVFARTGECAFMFRSASAQLVQKPDITPINTDGQGRLMVSAYSQAKPGAIVQLKVVVDYVDEAAEKEKLTVILSSSEDYIHTMANILINQPVAKAKYSLTYQAVNGKVLIDDASLLWQSGPIAPAAGADAELIPLP